MKVEFTVKLQANLLTIAYHLRDKFKKFIAFVSSFIIFYFYVKINLSTLGIISEINHVTAKNLSILLR